MALFAPIPLRGRSSVAAADLETNFKRIVDVLGGSAYYGGAPFSSNGYLSAANFRPGSIGNDVKAEPAAISVRQYTFPPQQVGAPPTVYLPAFLDLADAEILEASFAFAGFSAADATQINTAHLTVQFTEIDPIYGVSVPVSIFDDDFGPLAPKTRLDLTLETTRLPSRGHIYAYLWPLGIASADPVAKVLGGQLTLVLKSKHVA